MMSAYLPNRSKSKSLKTQIRDAERQVLNRQREVNVRASKLVSNIHRLMTAPANLLLAGGAGFIIGELTKRQTPGPGSCNTAGKPRIGEATSLRTALNLMASARAIYAALLPIAWMMKAFFQPHEAGASAQTATPTSGDIRCGR